LPSSPDLDLLAAVEKIAFGAGQVILDNKESAKNPIRKSDGSPVTLADQMADQFINAALAELTPNYPVVSEESVSEGRIPEVGASPFWLADPIDGTLQFMKGTDEYCTAFALIENHEPVLGLFYYPEKGVVCGAAGKGTAFFKEHPNADKQMLKTKKPVSNTLDVVVASTDEIKSDEVQEYFNSIPYEVGSIENHIGMWKHYLVASGQKDLYIRQRPTHDWDIAPGHAVLKAAGGVFQTLHGAPITYGNTNFLMPPLVAHANLSMAPQLVQSV